MKAIKNTLVLVTLTLGMLMSYASDKVSKGNYISVADENGAIIYSGRANNDGNIKTMYDFRNLEDGTYSVEIDKAFEIEVHQIEVKNNVAFFLDSETKKVHKPVFDVNNERVSISKLAFNNEELEVELYFEDELIYSENTRSETSIFNRVYKLDSSQRGSYKAVVKTKNRVFTKRFKI